MKKILNLLLVLGLCFSLSGCQSSLQDEYSDLVKSADKCVSEISKSEGMQQEQVKLKYKDIEKDDNNYITVIYSTEDGLQLKIKTTKNNEFDSITLTGDTDTAKNNYDFPAIVLGIIELSFFEFSDNSKNQIIDLIDDGDGRLPLGEYTATLRDYNNTLTFEISN